MPRTNVGILKKRIENGMLESYRFEETKSGARILSLKFSGKAYPDVVGKPEYQRELQPILEEFDRKRENAPAGQYADCNAYFAELGKCKALTELLCVTRGRCKFYKPK